MKTQVLSIQPLQRHCVQVQMLIGNTECHFVFSRKIQQIENRQLEIISYEKKVENLLRFHPEILDRLIDLVRKFDKGEKVKLPTVVGNVENSDLRSVSQKRYPFEISM
jgi:hypothetical protein